MQSSVRRPHKREGTEHPVASVLRLRSCNAKVYDRMSPVQHLRELPLQWRRPHTRPGAALRPGTAAVVKISAGLDSEAVSPLGTVVMSESASFTPQDHNMNTRVVPLAWLRHHCRFLRVPTVGPGRNRSIDTVRHPPRLCYRVSSEHWQKKSCGVRTLPAHASRWYNHLWET